MKRTEAQLPFAVAHTGTPSILYGAGAALLTLAVAAFGLWRQRLPRPYLRGGGRLLGPPIAALKAAHSGIVGEYVMWITAGTALMGAVWAFTLR